MCVECVCGTRCLLDLVRLLKYALQQFEFPDSERLNVAFWAEAP